MKRPEPPDDEPLLFESPPWDDEVGPASDANEAARAERPTARRRASEAAARPLPLPLFPELEPAESESPAPPPRSRRATVEEAEEVPELLFDPLPEDDPDAEMAEQGGFDPDAEPAAELGEEASFGARLLAGIADVAVHGAVLVLVLLGERLLGMRWSVDQWPGLAVFLLAFSFLYAVVPLAFWGQTPGMSLVGILTCTETGENLSFPQTAVRWAAALLTALLAGLPLLLVAGGGPSLGDRLSGSVTRRIAG